MTDDEILAKAYGEGALRRAGVWHFTEKELKDFARAIAAAEREALEPDALRWRFCRDRNSFPYGVTPTWTGAETMFSLRGKENFMWQGMSPDEVVDAAIRARSET